MLAAASLGCAWFSGRPSVDSAPPTADPLAHARAVLDSYLEKTQPLDSHNTLVAYDVAREGPELVPALLERLAEEQNAASAYHLTRLGCIMIRSGEVEAGARSGLRAAMGAAQDRMWYGLVEARLARAELRDCTFEDTDVPQQTAAHAPSG